MKPPSKLTWLTQVRRAALTSSEKLVLVMLGTYTNADGSRAHPGVPRLAADCAMSTRQVQRCLRSLTDRGCIELTTRGGNEIRKGWADEYLVHLDLEGRHGVTLQHSGSNEARATVSHPSLGARVTPCRPKGDCESREGRHHVTPPVEPSPGPKTTSSVLSRTGSRSRAIADVSGQPSAEDEQLVAAQVEEIELRLGYLFGTEERTVEAMLMGGSHAQLIVNKIRADRGEGRQAQA